MKLLSIETSSKICGVSLSEDDKLIDIIEQDNGLTHSESLMPLIKNILDKNNIKLNQIDGYICDIGPGSFTGIRIGVATVKAFIDSSSDCKYTGVDSLETLAYNYNCDGLICSIIDAKNENCYFALYDLKNKNYNTLIEPNASSISSMIKDLQKYKEKTITFIGDGALEYRNLIEQNINLSNFVNQDLNSINTANLAIAGYKKLINNTTNSLSPMYLKKPQAQRQLEEKENLNNNESVNNKVTTSNFKIRKMTLDDLETIKDILISDFDDFWDYNILKNELVNENCYYCIAQNTQDEIVGFAGVQFILDEANITNIVTKKDFRKLGIGSLLLNYLITISKEKKMASITLEVNENNIPAKNLYRKYRFNDIGFRKNYYNGTDNAIIMTLYF